MALAVISEDSHGCGIGVSVPLHVGLSTGCLDFLTTRVWVPRVSVTRKQDGSCTAFIAWPHLAPPTHKSAQTQGEGTQMPTLNARSPKVTDRKIKWHGRCCDTWKARYHTIPDNGDPRPGSWDESTWPILLIPWPLTGLGMGWVLGSLQKGICALKKRYKTETKSFLRLDISRTRGPSCPLSTVTWRWQRSYKKSTGAWWKKHGTELTLGSLLPQTANSPCC
jgi:hypothetical protein